MKIIDDLIEREGGYSDHAADKGGPTMYGITEKVARSLGYAGDMKNLPRAFAVAVYEDEYINKPGFGRVLAVSPAIAEEMIDTGVNMGVSHPGAWLQRVLNVMNNQGKLYPPLSVDGKIGNVTISALQIVLKHRGKDGETVILRALNCLQGARYLDITENRGANAAFFFGWMLNRVKI